MAVLEKAISPTVELMFVIELRFVTPKLATSLGPLGMVAGVQLLAFVQELSGGLSFQVALPAQAVARESEQRHIRKDRRKSIFMDEENRRFLIGKQPGSWEGKAN